MCISGSVFVVTWVCKCEGLDSPLKPHHSVKSPSLTWKNGRAVSCLDHSSSDDHESMHSASGLSVVTSSFVHLHLGCCQPSIRSRTCCQMSDDQIRILWAQEHLWASTEQASWFLFKCSVQVEQSKVLVKEGGVQLLLTIVDTPGFGDAVDNSNWWAQPSVPC